MNKEDLEIGQVYRTKDDHKLEIIAIHGNSVTIRNYVHRSSANCKSYGWKHNKVYFDNPMLLHGKFGFLKQLQVGGWKLETKFFATAINTNKKTKNKK